MIALRRRRMTSKTTPTLACRTSTVVDTEGRFRAIAQLSVDRLLPRFWRAVTRDAWNVGESVPGPSSVWTLKPHRNGPPLCPCWSLSDTRMAHSVGRLLSVCEPVIDAQVLGVA